MKHLGITLVCLPALAASAWLAGPAMAASGSNEGMYAGLSGDVTWLRHSKTGGGGNIALGYGYNDFRIEAEAGYHGAGGKTGYSGSHYFTYMGNVYYDFNTLLNGKSGMGSSGMHIVPYIGGGIGDAAVHFGHTSFTNTFHHHENDFAWQGMAGIKFASASAPNTDWYLGYRYLGTDQHNLHASNIELGMHFQF